MKRIPNGSKTPNGKSMNISPKYANLFRRATLDDLEEIVDLGVNLSQKHGSVYQMPAEGLSVAAEISRIIKYGICLVGHGAAAGGAVRPFIWNTHIMVGCVIFWNFTRPSGIHIFDALVLELEKHGATHLSTTSHFPKNRIGEFYAKRGMSPAETTFIGEIAAIKKSVA